MRAWTAEKEISKEEGNNQLMPSTVVEGVLMRLSLCAW